MMYYRLCFRIVFPLFSALLVTSCGFFIPEEEDVEPCPWNPESVGHWITLPLTVSPHKQLYKVGDTVRFSFHESVMVRDSNMKRRFDLSSFPFRPVHSMWRFEDGIDYIFAPLQEDNVIVEERFRKETIGSDRSLGYRMWAEIENDSFIAYSDVVLRSPGKYISSWYDVYTVTLEAAGGDRSYAEPIEFDGQCENHYFLIQNQLQGDDNLSNFTPELEKLDSLYYGNLLIDGAEQGSGLDIGTFSGNYRGFFGFEVVE